MRAIAFVLLFPITVLAGDSGIVPKDAKLEKLWGEGEFTEGPAYGPDRCIYFTDIGNRIMKFDPPPARRPSTAIPAAGPTGSTSIPRAGSSPARGPTPAAIAASPSPRRTAPSTSWPTSGRASASTAPTT